MMFSIAWRKCFQSGPEMLPEASIKISTSAGTIDEQLN